MNNIKVIMLDPDMFYLADQFCEEEGLPLFNPEWSKVVAAIDLDTEKVVAVMVCQMVAHAEPIWINEKYRGNGVWKEMADHMDSYLNVIATYKGAFPCYNQPTHPEAEHLCEVMGYDKADYPLWVKIYKGDSVWPQQSPQQLDLERP